ncbi:MAG: efflux RND transporter permease subunit [Desulfatitalea sp.]|nr:efflux RND transporter permease subunit [Desulfatitalea sp.]
MDILKYAISKPVTVAVGALLVVLFGVIGLIRLPVQLAPDTELPRIEVFTIWTGATPSEIESEVVEKQEDKLKSIQDLQKMESTSYNDFAQVTLTFGLGTDINTAVQRVSNKLDEVWDYPDDVKKPIINTSGANASPSVILTLKMRDGDPREVTRYQTYFENEIQQYLERVDGVASIMAFGGTADQLEVEVDPIKMARHGITINQVISKVSAANKDTSAGLLNIDRKSYRIRTAAKFETVDDPLDVVILDDGRQRIFLRDIATTRMGHETQMFAVFDGGSDSIVIMVRRQTGANVLDLVENIRSVVDHLNKEVLPEHNLYLKWNHDQAPYILKAIRIVQNNVFLGGILAVAVLLLFLRSFRSTLITALSIPVSAVGTFLFLWLLDRNINVVSLAGISFAVGMLVDNSIVVLENIDRHRQMGKRISRAAYEGTKEVYGAVIASTLTTVAVFLPVIFMREEAGQLFKDIAIAITAAILLSLLVSVTMIPTAMNRAYGRDESKKKRFQSGHLDRLGAVIVRIITTASLFCRRTIFLRLASVIGFTSLALLIAWALMPKAEYLPQGNQNIIMTILVPPPGYSESKRREIGDYIFSQIKPYMEEDGRDGIPQIKHTFYVNADMFTLVGSVLTEENETRARELIPLMNRIANSLPDMFGVSIQPGIFQTDLGQGRTVDVNISGDDLPTIIQSAGLLFGTLSQAISNAQIRPVPSLEMTYPEVNIIPDKRKLAASGLTETDLGNYVAVMSQGKIIGEYRPTDGYQINLVVRAPESTYLTPEAILNALIANNHGQLIRIGDVAHIEYSQGMTQIARLEKRRNIRLEVTPPDDLPLQAALEQIDAIVADLKQQGMLQGVAVATGGNADKLTETFDALKWNFVLAVLIIYLLMSALFENFFYPLIILFAVPLAAAGGFLGLWLVNATIAPQPLDVLTMLGFIILVGSVVNNAILIVHQSLNNVRFEAMPGPEAINEAVRTRIRPIFMSAATTILALSPMVLSTGSGSEMYRGIGSVLLGGLALSTVFTLVVIPALLAFFIGFEKPRTAENGGI